jgi:hypothetical protein
MRNLLKRKKEELEGFFVKKEELIKFFQGAVLTFFNRITQRAYVCFALLL